MHKIFIVAKNVFSTRILKPTYYWMIFAPLLLAVGALLFNYYSAEQQKNSQPSIAIIAPQGVREILNNSKSEYKVAHSTNLDKAKMLIKDGTLDGALYISKNFKTAKFIYNNLSDKSMPFEALQSDVNSSRATLQAQKLRLTQDQWQALFGNTQLKQVTYNESTRKEQPVYNGYSSTQIFSQAATILVFFLLTSYISIAGTEIGREKGDHLLESIVSAMPAKNHFAGKMLGVLYLIGFQLFIYGIVFSLAKIGLHGLGKDNLIDFTQIQGITWQYATITTLLMVSAVMLYVLLASLLASFVSRSEDISQATSSVASFMLIPYFVSFIAQDSPNGTISVMLSYLPFTAHGLMPIRISHFATSYTNGWISVAISFAAVIIMYLWASRTYQKNVFNYSELKPLKALISTFKKQ
ncbi:ABC transporter permease [Weissella cibaria]|uniref:ABC transporter permease n=1 Tax=Weissella cibaria TaxID=137591 RepID=UPI00223B6BBB|nr:ABC transporter permease [Weissella cibaria]